MTTKYFKNFISILTELLCVHYSFVLNELKRASVSQQLKCSAAISYKLTEIILLDLGIEANRRWRETKQHNHLGAHNVSGVIAHRNRQGDIGGWCGQVEEWLPLPQVKVKLPQLIGEDFTRKQGTSEDKHGRLQTM